MTEEREYILGTDQAELQRLGFQHRVWSESAAALWERAGIGPGQTVLDIGCGPGWASLDLARIVAPDGRVIAVDVSARYVEHLTAERARLGLADVIETRVQDVQAMTLDPDTVDLAYARWVLCFVPDPEAVVAAVARALRAGGTFAIQDYYLYTAAVLAPHSAAFTRVFEATATSWKHSGGDPAVAMRLPAMLERHGLRVRDLRPLVRVGRPGTMLWEWPRRFFRLYVPRLVEGGWLTRDEEAAFWRDFDARGRDPGAFFVTPPMVDIVARKE